MQKLENFLNATATTTTTTTVNPANFSNNNLELDDNIELNSDINPSTTSNGAARPKFSFASNYTPSHHFSGLPASYDYASNLPISVPSFAVLNNDYIASSPHTKKPNAIVHPVRRAEQANADNDFEQELRVTGYNPSLSVTHPQLGASDAHHFAEELNRKLSHLSSIQERRDYKSSSHHGSNQDTLSQRPLFITTVPRGIFLPPPKEIVLLSPSRKRQLYAYSSHPVVYNTISSTLPSSYYNNTHNGHKIKGTSEQIYNNKNTSTMAKDKYRNNNERRDDGATDGGTSVIGVTDKSLKAAPATAGTTQTNGLRGSYASTTPVPGGFHMSKQQFQQQLKQTNSKREIPAEPYKNIMYERRVVRGSNFGGTQLLEDYDPFDKAAELRRRQILRKKNVTHKNQRNVLGTPPPVAGRRHEDVQTDKYLEELVARPTEATIETQTDLFLEKPPTPPFVPAKIGIDVGTEIKDGELFHFDAEAQPIIDVMVDNILELSILEVAHEQEMSALRKKQAEFLAEREKELAELRRLEEEEIRLKAEKERRLRQDAIAKSLDDEMQKEVTAAKLLQGHIASILPEVLDNLEPAADAFKKEQLMKTICPWLSAEVAEEVGQIVDSREILTVIIQEIIKQRAEVYAGYKEAVPVIDLNEQEEEHTAGEVCETDSESNQPSCPPDSTLKLE